MDEVVRLITAFDSYGKRDHSIWKLDILMDLGRIDDPRAVGFLIAIVEDADEPIDVRSDALGRLREGSLSEHQRGLVVDTAVHALTAASGSELRLRAVSVLGAFVDIERALRALGDVALNTVEPLDLRYDAFTLLQRAGPTPACLDILQALTTDETFGQSARSLLTCWQDG